MSGSTSFPVSLNVYDLSAFDTSGMIKKLAQQFMPSFQGIWHSGIVVYGKEYYYGGGLLQGNPGITPYGVPTNQFQLGTTEIPEQVFDQFVEEMKEKYTLQNYDIFTHNCNHFTNDASMFLTGSSIPSFITELPKMFMESPMGSMLMPLIRQFTTGGNVDPASMQHSMQNMMNAFGGGGMGNLQNMMNLGGANNQFSAPVQVPPTPESIPVVSKTGHEALSFTTLPVRTQQTTLFSTSSSVPKIFMKLKQVVFEVDVNFMSKDRNQEIAQELEKGLGNRAATPNFSIPLGTFKWIETLFSLLPETKVFPVIDIFRLLVLHPTAAEYFSNPSSSFINDMITTFVISSKPPSIPGQWLGARVVSNLCGMEIAGKNMVIPSREDQLMDIISLGLASSVKQMKFTAATLCFNLSVRCQGNGEVLMQLLSATCHALGDSDLLGDDSIFILLLALGKQIYGNSETLELVSVFEVTMEPFLKSKNQKVQAAATEIDLLLKTPLA